MIPPEVDDGRLQRAWTALAERALPSAACPEPARLWAAVRGELTPGETSALVDHTAGCPACAEAWRLARDVGPAAPARPEVGRPARSSAWRGGWGAVAAAVAAVAVVSAVLLGRAPEVPQYRAAEETAIRSLVSEERPLPRAAFVLRWTPGPAGSRYTVEVATEELTPLARAGGLTAAEYAVSEAALRGVPAGGRVLWRVETVLPDGSRAGSATFRTHVQ